MNKKRVDGWLLKAKDALEKTGIAKDGVINRGYRGQISSFGAAVVMGSLTSAVAFFVEQGESAVDRPRLLESMYYVIFDNKVDAKDVLMYVCENDSKERREKFVDAAIAVKLAMNFFELT